MKWNGYGRLYQVLGFVCVQVAQAQGLHSQTLYGGDHRLEAYEVRSASVQENMSASVAFFGHGSWVQQKGGNFELQRPVYFENETPACPDHRFDGQAVNAYCSGVWLGERFVLTAGHCFESSTSCLGAQVVFNYSLKGPLLPNELAAPQVTSNDVFECKKILRRHLSETGYDFALIELDRVPQKKNVIGPTLFESYSTFDGETVYSVSHPFGLPTKVSQEGARLKRKNRYFDLYELDVSGGSSGGPVFDSLSHRLWGLVIEGEEDFDQKNYMGLGVSPQLDGGKKCKREKVCLVAGACQGESIIRMDSLLPALSKVVRATRNF